MKKVITSFGFGSHAEMLDVALPSFREYAKRHGYDLFLPSESWFDDTTRSRPHSWWKVPLLKYLLSDAAYDAVLWLDADTVIIGPRTDLLDEVDLSQYWQAMVFHQVQGEVVPNCGVWLLTRGMVPVLSQAWEQTEFLNFCWWEQAAIIRLMGVPGVSINRGDGHGVPTELYRRSLDLDLKWNWHRADSRGEPVCPRIMHAAAMADRVSVMREWTRWRT